MIAQESSAAWGHRYDLEKGDVVKVKDGHPFGGQQGAVEVAYGMHQFGITLTSGLNITIRTSMVTPIAWGEPDTKSEEEK